MMQTYQDIVSNMLPVVGYEYAPTDDAHRLTFQYSHQPVSPVSPLVAISFLSPRSRVVVASTWIGAAASLQTCDVSESWGCGHHGKMLSVDWESTWLMEVIRVRRMDAASNPVGETRQPTAKLVYSLLVNCGNIFFSNLF